MIPLFCFPLTWLVSLTAELALDYLYCIYICLIVILHMDAYRVVQKSEATNSWPQFCQILTDLHFFTGRLLGKFAVNWLLKIPPLVKMWWVVNNQIKKGSLPSLSVKNFKSVNSWQSYKKDRRCLVHFVHMATTAKRRRKCTRQPRSCL